MKEPNVKNKNSNVDEVVEALMARYETSSKTIEVQCVLEVLAMTMFADKQVLAAEIQCFVDVVLRLQKKNSLRSEMSEAEVITWYEDNKVNLASVLENQSFESWMDEKIESLKNFPDLHQLLLAMDEIAMADGERHVSEKAFEVLTSEKLADALFKKYNQKSAVIQSITLEG